MPAAGAGGPVADVRPRVDGEPESRRTQGGHIQGSTIYTPADFLAAAHLVNSRVLDVRPYITSVVPLGEVPGVLEAIDAGATTSRRRSTRRDERGRRDVLGRVLPTARTGGGGDRGRAVDGHLRRSRPRDRRTARPVRRPGPIHRGATAAPATPTSRERPAPGGRFAAERAGADPPSGWTTSGLRCRTCSPRSPATSSSSGSSPVSGCSTSSCRRRVRRALSGTAVRRARARASHVLGPTASCSGRSSSRASDCRPRSCRVSSASWPRHGIDFIKDDELMGNAAALAARRSGRR